MPHYPEQLNTFVIVQTHQGDIIDFKSIPQREFVVISAGMQCSSANPDGVNFFEEFNIPLCEAWYDEPFRKHIVDCPAIKDLWKLRFSKRPADPEPTGATTISGSYGAGWAKREFSPSEGQLKMLNEFGIYDYDDFAYGDDCFRLIKATTDAGWRGQYKSR